MDVPGRKAYYLNELVGSKWPNATKEAVLEWAEEGFFRLQVKAQFRLMDGEWFEGYAIIQPSDVRHFIKHDELGIGEFLNEKGEKIVPVSQDGVSVHVSLIRPIFSTDEKNKYAPATINVSYSELVVLTDEVESFEKKNNDLLGITTASPQKPMAKNTQKLCTPKEERTDIHIIGGLVELLLESTQEVLDEKPPYRSKAKLIKVLLERNEGLFGMTKRTLEDRFAAAVKAINEVD